MKATVLITTRNRKDDLVRAVASALQQTAQPEVVVIDDGSTDGTSKLIKSLFPQVVLHRSDFSEGYIVQRNRGIRLATSPIIFSIDDDAVFSTPTIVADVLREFDSPRIGAVAIPFIDVNKDANSVRQQAPDGSKQYICPAFIGTAHALRKDVFLSLGGYRESLFHQGEEGDYCLRMLEAGYVVRLGRSDVIHHFESPRRDFQRMDIYGRRNNVLFYWHLAPLFWLLPSLVGTTWNGLRHGWRVRRVRQMARGLLKGYGDIWKERAQRAPVEVGTFKLYREFVRRNFMELSELENCLPPLRPLQ